MEEESGMLLVKGIIFLAQRLNIQPSIQLQKIIVSGRFQMSFHHVGMHALSQRIYIKVK